LPDGVYDVLVIDADGSTLELTLVAGDHKGEVIAVTSSGPAPDPMEVMGMPATLTVADGVPRVAVDG
jgi:hypothetical protein